MIKIIRNNHYTFLEHHEHDLDLDVIGRYLVFSKNGDKNYVSLRTKKNIDLQDILVNITSERIINKRNYRINNHSITNLPNGNKLGIM